MMAPMQRSQARDARNTQRDHAIGGFGGQLVLHDQGRQAGDQQQRCDTAQAVRTVVMMMGMLVVAVMAMTVMPPVMAISVAVAVAAFIEREFVAHTDIKFAHSVSLVFAAQNRPQGEYHHAIIKSQS
jgi:hypothetical protein